MLSLCLHWITLELALHVWLFFSDGESLQILGDGYIKVVSKVFRGSFVLLAKLSECTDWCKTELWSFKTYTGVCTLVSEYFDFWLLPLKVWSELQHSTGQQSNLKREDCFLYYIQSEVLFGYWNLWIFFPPADTIGPATITPAQGPASPAAVNGQCQLQTGIRILSVSYPGVSV